MLLLETKTTGIQPKKRVTTLKFGMTVALKRYNVELLRKVGEAAAIAISCL